MDETKKKFTLKELLTMDLKDLKNLKSKSVGSTSVSSSNIKKEKKKKAPKKVVAFDIESNSTKIVIGKHEKEKLIIENLIDIPTPEETVVDGKIMNDKVLLDIIQYTLKENKINVKDGIFTTDSTSIINRELLIPKVQEDEIDTVIRYEIQQFLPINLNDYILQYTILGEVENPFDGSIKYRINVVSYPDKSARAYYNLLNDMEIRPYALDIIHNSAKKLLNLSDKINENENSSEETVALIDMGAESINVNIYKNKELDFTRVMRSGGNDIDRELSQKLNMSLKSVEATKIEKANLQNLSEDDEVNIVVKEVVEEWLMDLGRILQFYRNKLVENKIDKIYMYGGSSNINGLDKFMENKLNVFTEKIDKIGNVEFSKPSLSNESIGQYVNAIGSIIRL